MIIITDLDFADISLIFDKIECIKEMLSKGRECLHAGWATSECCKDWSNGIVPKTWPILDLKNL